MEVVLSQEYKGLVLNTNFWYGECFLGGGESYQFRTEPRLSARVVLSHKAPTLLGSHSIDFDDELTLLKV